MPPVASAVDRDYVPTRWQSPSMLIAFSVSPSGGDETGGVSAAVAEAVKVVRDSGLPCETNAMFTNVEGEWDEVMAVVKRAVNVVAPRRHACRWCSRPTSVPVTPVSSPPRCAVWRSGWRLAASDQPDGSQTSSGAMESTERQSVDVERWSPVLQPVVLERALLGSFEPPSSDACWSDLTAAARDMDYGPLLRGGVKWPARCNQAVSRDRLAI